MQFGEKVHVSHQQCEHFGLHCVQCFSAIMYIAHMHNLNGLSVTSKCAVQNDHLYMVKKKIPLIVNFAKLISKYPLNGGGSSFVFYANLCLSSESTGTFLMVCNPLKKEPKAD